MRPEILRDCSTRLPAMLEFTVRRMTSRDFVLIRAHAHNNLLLKCLIYYHFYLIFCLQVLDKFPVAQHFPFGTILSIEPATAAPAKE